MQIDEKNDTVTGFIQLSDQEYSLLRDLIYSQFGINLGERKRALIIGRLNKVLKHMGFSDFQQYYDYVISDSSGDALTTLINRISTNHTYFYREADHFHYFSQHLLPEMAEKLKKQHRQDLRIWCPGCSSGEEPYTLAMLIAEFFGKDLPLWDPGILATDISLSALDKARNGIYLHANVSALPPNLQRNYFQRLSQDESVVIGKLKDMILFRRLNLMGSRFPFKRKFHVIFCRNVMIYFDKPTRETLIDRFSHYLEGGGYLFIGHSETLGRENPHFTYVQPAIYRKEP
jgi:chemotaxis protein methyltransferase CheR